MSDFNMQNYKDTFRVNPINFNSQSVNHGINMINIPDFDIANLVNKIDSVLGNDDKKFSKTDSTLERENIPRIDFSKMSKQKEEPIMIQSTFHNPSFDFGFNKEINTNNQIKLNNSYMIDNNAGKRDFNSILKDITKINSDLDSIGSLYSPPTISQSSYRPISQTPSSFQFQSDYRKSYEPSVPSYILHSSNNNEQSLDSIIQNVVNLVQNMKNGSSKQAGIDQYRPPSQFSYFRENDYPYQQIRAPEKTTFEDQSSFIKENIGFNGKQFRNNYKQESPASQHSATDRSKLVREAEISPMKFQPDFTSEHLNKIHSQLENEEEKFDSRSNINEPEQSFTIHKVCDNQDKILREQEPIRRGLGMVRNRSQSRGNCLPPNITRVNARTPTRINSVEDLYSEHSQSAIINAEPKEKPKVQYASKFINIPTNITTRSRGSRDSYV